MRLYIEKTERYAIIHCVSGKYKTRKTLQELEQCLGQVFFRSHKSCIINIDQVERIVNYPSSSYLVLLNLLGKEEYPLFIWFRGINSGVIATRPEKRLFSQTNLFILCLVQVLMLTILIISFLIYTEGIYKSFTLDVLMAVGSIILMISVLATIFIAGYLLQIANRKARLEMELHHMRERHNLNRHLQVERHDFYNHLTAIYGYVKTGCYARAESYIENFYQSVRHISSLLEINPPELAAVLSVKQQEAKAKNIEFRWQINMEREFLLCRGCLRLFYML